MARLRVDGFQGLNSLRASASFSNIQQASFAGRSGPRLPNVPAGNRQPARSTPRNPSSPVSPISGIPIVGHHFNAFERFQQTAQRTLQGTDVTTTFNLIDQFQNVDISMMGEVANNLNNFALQMTPAFSQVKQQVSTAAAVAPAARQAITQAAPQMQQAFNASLPVVQQVTGTLVGQAQNFGVNAVKQVQHVGPNAALLAAVGSVAARRAMAVTASRAALLYASTAANASYIGAVGSAFVLPGVVGASAPIAGATAGAGLGLAMNNFLYERGFNYDRYGNELTGPQSLLDHVIAGWNTVSNNFNNRWRN